jgi:protein O-GlcNAc transferase
MDSPAQSSLAPTIQPGPHRSLFRRTVSKCRLALSNVLCAVAEGHAARRSPLTERWFKWGLWVQPRNLGARHGLALFYLRAGRISEGILQIRAAIAHVPNNSASWTVLGLLTREAGLYDETVRHLHHAVALNPSRVRAAQQVLFQEFYAPELVPSRVRAAHERWARTYAAPHYPRTPPAPIRDSAGRRLRIGYVSPDWKYHPVAKFSECFLRHHDRSRFEVFCYSCTTRVDARTRALARLPEHWVEATRLTDDELCAQIRRDGIDVLVDLAGHTPGSRALVFARQPAPVQVNFISHVGTTGIATIGYRVTDAFADPPGLSEAHWTEQLVRLPETAWCFAAPVDAPPVAPLPATHQRSVTFGSLSHLGKLSPATLATWSRLLHDVPDSRLLLVRDPLHDHRIRARFMQCFTDSGIAPDRIDLRGWPQDMGNRLAAYHALDIALDPFPFNGMTTTCDALHMGVPVIALAGKIHVARMGVSVLNNVGLADLCLAHSEADYVEKAARLAADRTALADLRRALRPRMERSPLMDGPRFTRHLETAFDRLANRT